MREATVIAAAVAHPCATAVVMPSVSYVFISFSCDESTTLLLVMAHVTAADGCDAVVIVTVAVVTDEELEALCLSGAQIGQSERTQFFQWAIIWRRK